MSKPRQTPTIAVQGPDLETGEYTLTAHSYSRTMPAGYGAFSTREEAEKKAATVRAMLAGKEEAQAVVDPVWC